IVQPARAGFDNGDAKIVMAGLSGEYGRARPLAPLPPPTTTPPAGEKREKPEAIELPQRILFASGAPTILPRSLPLLDEVAAALKSRPSLRVRVEGHADAQ